MKKICLSILLAIFLFVTASFVTACRNPDQRFTMIVSDIEIDMEEIQDLCTQKSCTIKQDYIAIKSLYHPNVSLIMGNTGGTLGIHGLMTKLPYQLNQSCCQERGMVEEKCYQMKNCLIPTTLIPENYNWSASINTDLYFLKDLGVIDITQEDINDISSIARGTGIRNCSDGWKVTGDCSCDGSCPDCIGTAFFPTMPENYILEKYSGDIVTSENKIHPIIWISGVLIVAICGLMIFLVGKKR